MAREIDLRTRVVTGALQRQHGAFTELGVEHLHAVAQAVHRQLAFWQHLDLARAETRLRPVLPGRRAGRATIPLATWRDPLQRGIRQLVEENERLRLEQAALGRTNEALARSLDSRLSQSANLRKYAAELLDYVDKIVGQLDPDTAELIRKNALVLPGDLVSIPNEHAAVFLGVGPGGSIPPGVADALQAPGSHDFTADALSRMGITNYQQLAISGVTNFTVQRPPSEARE